MIVQYPHFLFVIEAMSASVQDENGNWVGSGTAPRYIGRCREETAGAGSEFQVAGGTFLKASALIQLPEGTERVPDGSTVIIADDAGGNDVRIRGTVLHFDQGQLHSRLWL